MTVAEAPHYKFNVDEYYRIYDAGVFHEDDHIELLDGEILLMTPIGSKHLGCVHRLNRLFSQRLGNKVIVSVQSPVRLKQNSEPEPDVALLRLEDDFYAGSHPTSADVLLIVEVAETSIDYDRLAKLPQYAGAGIQEVWIVNLNEDVLEVYREPCDDCYQAKSIYSKNQYLSSLAFPDEKLYVRDMMPSSS